MRTLQPTKVLFICHGNICRSPAAECIFTALAERAGVLAQFEIDSAGTSQDHEGSSPYPDTQIVLRERGYTVFGKSRPIIKRDIAHFDCVVCMDQANHRNVIAFGFLPERVSLLLSHDPSAHDVEVGDPWGYPDAFAGMADVIEPACAALLHELLERRARA